MGREGTNLGQPVVTAPTSQADSAVIKPRITAMSFANNIPASAIPAYVTAHDKNAVGISGRMLDKVLDLYYKAGLRDVEAVLFVEGQAMVVEGKIYVRRDKQTNRHQCWLYPLQPAQSLLRDLYRKYRGETPRRIRRPMPVLIIAIRPK
jgi:hypothetical protein